MKAEGGRYRFARVEVNEGPTSLTLGSVTSGVARELLDLF